MTDQYAAEKFNQRVEELDIISPFDLDEVTDTAIEKRKIQIETSLDRGELSVRTYNELFDILDEVEP